jgi:hypothetical protein
VEKIIKIFKFCKKLNKNSETASFESI